jgi:hypothetical protein
MTVARLVAFAVVATACTRTWQQEAVQPNPVLHPTETLRVSEKITIVTSQMGLEVPLPAEGVRSAQYTRNRKYPLLNQASFTLVSRDRLRFHVQVDHTWDEYADLTTWEVKLEDDQGHTWSPESVEHVRRKVLTTMWDKEQRTSQCDSRGRDAKGDCFNTVGFYDDGWRRRTELGNISVFRGNGDFVFYQRDIMSPQVRWLKLTMRRSGQEFAFTWRFEDEVASN